MYLQGMNEGATASSTAADGPDKKGPPPKKTPNDYIFGKVIGEGSFSSVSICIYGKEAFHIHLKNKIPACTS